MTVLFLMGSTKRIATELANLAKLGPDCRFRIVPASDADITKLVAVIRNPDDSPYEGGITLFSIDMGSGYPFSPPKVIHQTTAGRIHPNLYGYKGSEGGGKVCLDILNTFGKNNWSMALTLEQVFHTICSLMDKNALKCEPGQERVSEKTLADYDNCARAITLAATIDWMTCANPINSAYPPEIVSIIRDKSRIPQMLKSAEKLVDGVFNTMHHRNFVVNKRDIIRRINELS